MWLHGGEEDSVCAAGYSHFSKSTKSKFNPKTKKVTVKLDDLLQYSEQRVE